MKAFRYFLKNSLILCFLPSLWILLSVACTPFPGRTSSDAPDGFVDILEIDPGIRVDMMYFSPENFLGRPAAGYRSNTCYLRKEAAEALKKANQRLQARAAIGGKKISLRVRDCYRPAQAVQDFVAWTKDNADTKMKGRFYPDLSKADLLRLGYIAANSGHTRGFSVDLTISEIDGDKVVRDLPMGTDVDFFGERSHTAFPGLKKEERENRQWLLEAMQPEFKNYAKEWWHFSLKEEPSSDKNDGFEIIAGEGITTHVSDPHILGQLDLGTQGPLSLMALFKRVHSENGLAVPKILHSAKSSGATLAHFTETYGRFVSIFSSDLSRILGELGIDWEKDITKTYLPAAARTEPGKQLRLNGNVMRAFNEKWLSSEDGRFILAGIVNRIDRKDFDPSGCGELRLIYRLGYEVPMRGKTYASRMPFTVNMVFNYLNDRKGCREVTSLWAAENTSSAQGLLAKPLDFSKLKFRQMEVNAQIARFPSDLENDEHRNFAGQAIYWMRIFALSQGRMEPQKLENTPDVAGILKDPEKQGRLREFLEKNLAEIDAGVFLLPQEFLADLALSYSTLGSARIANKPFQLILSEKQADAILARYPPSREFRFIHSGASLLERLNTSSCMGCHQSASTAGFHFLGKDRFDFGKNPDAIKKALDGNRLQIPFSPHFYSEISRRQSYLERLAKGMSPDIFRPHAVAPPLVQKSLSFKFQPAKAGMPCVTNKGILADAFTWSCDQGLRCETLTHNSSLPDVLGKCVVPEQEIFAGLACRRNDIEDHTARFAENGDLAKNRIAYNLNSFQDRVINDEPLYELPTGKLNASEFNCRPTRIGVPLGRITRSCTPDEMSLRDFKSKESAKQICAIVGGKGFEEMAKGYFDSEKFSEGVARGVLDTCGPGRNCREDYICQEMPDFLVNERFNVEPEVLQDIHREGIGFCTPTYFIYQLRLDGHPNPS